MALDGGRCRATRTSIPTDRPTTATRSARRRPRSTSRVDVAPTRAAKRLALAAHASQVTDIGMFLAMPEDVFAAVFGTEWYIEPGAEPGLRDGWLLEGA